MKILINGFGMITPKQALNEVKELSAMMQEAYHSGKLELAIRYMNDIKPFVNALKHEGYSIEQIFGE